MPTLPLLVAKLAPVVLLTAPVTARPPPPGMVTEVSLLSTRRFVNTESASFTLRNARASNPLAPTARISYFSLSASALVALKRIVASLVPKMLIVPCDPLPFELNVAKPVADSVLNAPVDGVVAPIAVEFRPVEVNSP